MPRASPSPGGDAHAGPATVVPAQLAFLAIYNPALGPNEDTLRDQIVFYWSRAEHEEVRGSSKNNANRGGSRRLQQRQEPKRPREERREDGEGGGGAEEEGRDGDEAAKDEAARREREAENERLRQVGLAQGMVNFARTFSRGEPVESVETDKSRIVLGELERGWWILASIDLTRIPILPAGSPPPKNSKAATPPPAPQPTVEYSSREVSPPPLLLAQLRRAHSIFLLHHAPSLQNLYERTAGRARFCALLARFWTRFCAAHWDVLLHGNPSVDVYGGIKLAAGGELGMGVGEEEWGSGEREVLEHVAGRTEGLVDLVVARFGEPSPDQLHDPRKQQALRQTSRTPPGSHKHGRDGHKKSQAAAASPAMHLPEPWLGAGQAPSCADGIVFSGVGGLARQSLRDVAAWMEWVYAQGERAYGVRDNPSSAMGVGASRREARERRRKERERERGKGDQLGQGGAAANGKASKGGAAAIATVAQGRPRARDSRLEGASPTSSTSNATGALIPPPIVSAAERSLDSAVEAAGRTRKREEEGTSPEQQPKREGSQGAGSKSALADPDVWMKVFTLGYGSAWGGGSGSGGAKAGGKDNERGDNGLKEGQEGASRDSMAAARRDSIEDQLVLHHVDPEPEPEPEPEVDRFEERLRAQIQRENNGSFIIGLRGDLDDDDDEEEDDQDDESPGDWNDRTVLRTVQVKLSETAGSQEPRPLIPAWQREMEGTYGGDEFRWKRLRVLVYIHRPFIYTLLFDPTTASLALPGLYRTLHTFLSPLHRNLCLSTSPSRVAARLASAANPTSTLPPLFAPSPRAVSSLVSQPIYDLVFDPHSLFVHASIPNIPDPGTATADGLALGSGAPAPLGGATTATSSPAAAARAASPSPAGRAPAAAPAMSRVDALNVHAQMLETVAATRRRGDEVERCAKTSRGWWVAWMRLPPPSSSSPSSSLGSAAAAAAAAPQAGPNDAAEPANATADAATRDAGAAAGRDAPDRAVVRTDSLGEAFLVRRSRDALPGGAKGGGSGGGARGAGGGQGGGGGAWSWPVPHTNHSAFV
ncbi:hypothetical protein BDY21DRAFT_418634 [Lineolata rhizophorae]|uniref:CCZ1/INTU/HSP4 first Longin domain-containing protein n=1 Tax=Lineolata rhizophorae TaxID=578093 RepID=A0A6A6PCE4_9PEZI|nr:hypothetical protein BDY21DRAFT_418634 [Lineolata rhizophorae]